MGQEFIGAGWAFPLRTDPTGGIALVSREREIEESIRLILATAPGERPMRPEFGCAVHDHVFAPADDAFSKLPPGSWDRLTKDKVRFYKTPDSILQKQLEIYDQVVAKKSVDNPLFKEIVASQKAFAERAVKWDMDNNVNRRMAYTHYFGAKARAAKKA